MLCLKSLRLSLLVIVILIFVSANSVSAEGIYSKADATQMFEMSMSEWNANVMAVQTKGAGQALGNPTDGFGLAIQMADEYLIVRPNYRSLNQPEFLSVTIGYPPEQAQYLTETILEQLVALSIKQLAPEFVMTAKMRKVDQGVAIMAIIRKHDPY